MRDARRTRGILTALATGAIVAGSLAFANPAQAAVTGFVSGPVGVAQTISIDAVPSMMGQSTCTMAPSINGVQQPTVSGAIVNGTATFQWTPQTTGAATFTMPDCSTTSTIPAVTISQTPTFTVVNAPNTAQVGVATKITVTVQSNSPSSYTPTGTVTVKDGQGNVIQKMGLAPTAPNSGQSYAYWWFTAPSTGNYVFQATYSGDANAQAGNPSPQDIMFASPSGNTISLAAPSTLTVGVPVTLTATLVPANIQGSVGFTYNGAPISASIPIQNGTASFTWTPPAPGAATLGASYTTNGGASGSTTDKVIIVAGPAQSDVITLTQPGYGTWAPNGTYSLPNGSSTTMQASSISGSAVTLTETGPCQVSGLTITVPVGSGTCNIQARTAGSNGYAPVTFGYTVNAVPGQQTAVIAAPQSGKVAKGRTIVLETPDQVDTNAGQNINWKITKGKGSVCKLVYPNDGSVNLKMTGKGKCTVKGYAPGIPNQWAPYQVMRTYHT